MARFERRGFRSFSNPRYDEPKPVNVGEEYDVEIGEVGTRGDGIARIKNFVVFIADAKKGEKVRVKIKEVRERFATAEKVGAEKVEAAETEEKMAEKVEEPAKEIETESVEETEEEE